MQLSFFESPRASVESTEYARPSDARVVEAHGELPIMYVAGDVSFLARPMVAVIGSRVASGAGLDLAASVARELVGLGRVVVSGLAVGVDTAAHRAAIDAGGRTIAVIGTDLDHVYPRENARLQERISREHLLISPFASGTATRAFNFPMRNRLMACLSSATVVVEAREGSGTRYQVRECLRLGRPVLVQRHLTTDVGWVHELHEAGRVVAWSHARELRELL